MVSIITSFVSNVRRAAHVTARRAAGIAPRSAWTGIAAACAAAFVVASCAPSIPQRPYGSLGDGINTPADEVAPLIRPGDDALYFTSNRSGTEDLLRTGVGGVHVLGSTSDGTRASNDAVVAALTRGGTNDGTIAFVTENSGFFASAHAPDAAYAARIGTFGGIVGGSDLFEFSVGQHGAGAAQVTASNLGLAVNSPFWDAHPSASLRGDTTLLVFASDRPAPQTGGFSAPYIGSATLARDGRTVRGNADLYYVFRVAGAWGSVVNLAMTDPRGLVNSGSNEYTPFLYCVGQRPRLYFASDRDGSFDIYEADLAIDFARRTVTPQAVRKLASGVDSINTTSDEIFPHVVATSPDGDGSIYVASNRDSMPCMCNEGEGTWSAGGFDLYRFPISCECRVPRVRCEVVLLDADDPSRAVSEPVVRLYRTPAGANGAEPRTANDAERRSTHAVFDLEPGTRYTIFGGSTFDHIDCRSDQRTIRGYAFVRPRELAPTITLRDTTVQIDTMVNGRPEHYIDTIRRIDTVAAAALAGLRSTPTSLIESIRPVDGGFAVTRAELVDAVRIVHGTIQHPFVRRRIADTTRHMRLDTVLSTTELAASSRTRREGMFSVTLPAADTTVTDTIYVRPVYFEAPPCNPLDTRIAGETYRTSVPYFQTLFWEVNSTENLRSYLRRIDTGRLAAMSFIELNPRNSHFDGRADKRAQRLEDYRQYAAAVDSNLIWLASQLGERIIPRFLADDRAAPDVHGRLVIELAAYSDSRRIAFGYYAGDEEVRYVAGRLDSLTGLVALTDVDVRPGASLTSVDNDTLSKLRVYFAWRELERRLFERAPELRALAQRGELLMPTAGISAEEFRRRMERAKVVVLMEGRQVDQSASGRVSGDEDQDRVRRIDVWVNLKAVEGSRLLPSPCCSGSRR